MATFKNIIEGINKALADFEKTVPGVQRKLYENVTDELRVLELNENGSIKISVNNIRLLSKIKGELANIILSEDYVNNVKIFVDQFNTIAALQNSYFKSIESKFKPTKLLNEIKKQSIDATIDSLTESGISTNVVDPIYDLLSTSITTGGSVKVLEQQLKNSLTNIGSEDGTLLKYTKLITTDSLNMFSANYTLTISDDLGYEWFNYQGSDITTTRPFCRAMTENQQNFFHISEIPRLLKAEDLYYTNPKTGKKELVPIYKKTGLPQGMKAETNVTNFRTLRGGWNCGHQIGPISEGLVPKEIVDRVKQTLPYKTWKAAKKV